MPKKRCGIYEIRCVVSGKTYVGSSCDIASRWYQHRRDLRKLKHTSPRLQQAWNKHGEHNFVFSVLEECERDRLLEREQVHIDAQKRDYNSMPQVRVVTKEMRAKITAAQRLRAALITHCRQGHEYTSENTYRSPNKGERRCKRCNAERVSRLRLRETPEQREERCRRFAAHYRANRDRRAAQMRDYAAKHKAEKREYDRLYRLRKSG